MNRKTLAALMAAVVLSGGSEAKAVPLFTSALKILTKMGGKEVVEAGGEKAVKETLERAVKEGGEASGEKLVALSSRYGGSVYKVTRESPVTILKALDDLPPDKVGDGLSALGRNPELSKLVQRSGSRPLRLEVAHPGLGARVYSQWGDEAASLGSRLTNDEMAVLAAHGDDFAKLAPADQAKVWGRLRAAPGEAIDFLEKHPKALLTSAGLVAFLGAKSSFVGTGEPGETGLAGQTVDRVAEIVSPPVKVIGTVLAGAIAGYALIKLWGVWRRERARVGPPPDPKRRSAATDPAADSAIGPGLNR